MMLLGIVWAHFRSSTPFTVLGVVNGGVCGGGFIVVL